MKKIVCVLLISLLCLGLVACGESAEQSGGSDGSSSASSQTAETKAADTTPTTASSVSDNGQTATTASADKMYDSIDALIEDPDMQDSIKATDSITEAVTTKIYADGNTLVYDFTFVDHIDANDVSSVKTTLDTSLDATKFYFEGVAQTLETYVVNVDDAKVKVIYRNDTGNVITSREFG